MYYLRACLTSMHVLQEYTYYEWICIIGWQEGMYYWRTCDSGGHVFHENMCYGRTCIVGGYVLQADMSCGKSWGTCLMRLCLKGGHVLL